MHFFSHTFSPANQIEPRGRERTLPLPPRPPLCCPLTADVHHLYTQRGSMVSWKILWVKTSRAPVSHSTDTFGCRPSFTAPHMRCSFPISALWQASSTNKTAETPPQRERLLLSGLMVAPPRHPPPLSTPPPHDPHFFPPRHSPHHLPPRVRPPEPTPPAPSPVASYPIPQPTVRCPVAGPLLYPKGLSDRDTTLTLSLLSPPAPSHTITGTVSLAVVPVQ